MKWKYIYLCSLVLFVIVYNVYQAVREETYLPHNKQNALNKLNQNINNLIVNIPLDTLGSWDYSNYKSSYFVWVMESYENSEFLPCILSSIYI